MRIKPFRQLFGYAISAKRDALYSQTDKEIRIEEASGHGLGYLFSPKERKKEKDDDEETPQGAMDAWEFLLRKVLKGSEMAESVGDDANGCCYAKRVQAAEAGLAGSI